MAALNRSSLWNFNKLKLIAVVFALLPAISLSQNNQNSNRANSNDPLISNLVLETTPQDLEYLLDLSVRMLKDENYSLLLARAFGQKIKDPMTGEMTTALSQSKLVYLLARIPGSSKDIETYLQGASRQSPAQKKSAVLDNYNKNFGAMAKDLPLIKSLKSESNPMDSVLLIDKSGKPGHGSIAYSANSAGYEDPFQQNPKTIPTGDNEQRMIDFVNSAKPGDRLFFDFFDFDMMKLAEAIADAKERGVDIFGVVDGNKTKERPDMAATVEYLKSRGVTPILMDPVGLNHVKLISIISKAGASRVLTSSGNPTHSCCSLEGDLGEIPAELRKNGSNVIGPNPNHLNVIESEFLARIVASEIRKSGVYGFRGTSDYPISGAFQVLGKNVDAKTGKQDFITMSFSPNGGKGNLMQDIYAPMLKNTSGPLIGSFYNVSSDIIAQEAVNRAIQEVKKKRAAGEPAINLIRFIGDGMFAVRDFSTLLKLSGYHLVDFDPQDPFTEIPMRASGKNGAAPTEADKNLLKARKKRSLSVFIDDPTEPILKPLRDLLTAEEWKNWQENIRTVPDWFRGSVKYNGKGYAYQMILHHKVLISPADHISNAGSSINFSDNGEGNQEQVILVRSREITKKLLGTIMYWFDQAGPEKAIARVVEAQNKKFKKSEIDLAKEVFLSKRSPGRIANSCLRVFSN